jgi:transketolase C-terminal domain/subunit
VGFDDSGVVVVGTHAGLAIGKDGPTEMRLQDLALMRTLHNVEILHPADGVKTRQMLAYVAGTRRPTYLRLRQQLQRRSTSLATGSGSGSPTSSPAGKGSLASRWAGWSRSCSTA